MQMNAFLAPLYQKDAFKAGSTDVGDVSWLTPTAQIHGNMAERMPGTQLAECFRPHRDRT